MLKDNKKIAVSIEDVDELIFRDEIYYVSERQQGMKNRLCGLFSFIEVDRERKTRYIDINKANEGAKYEKDTEAYVWTNKYYYYIACASDSFSVHVRFKDNRR